MNVVAVLKDFSDHLEEMTDGNIKQWFLMSSELIPISMSLAYILFVCIVGPKMMNNRKPLKLNRIMLAYNFVQIILNTYLYKQFKLYVDVSSVSWHCIRPEYPGSKHFYTIKRVQWLFLLSRLLDWMDTIFFVLRKKQSHVSFLHVYHHMLTFVGSWFGVKYLHAGAVIFFALINSAVHAIMYTYYALLNFPQTRSYALLFKKPITQIQIGQFFVCGIHGLWAVYDPSCGYSSNFLTYLGISQLLLMIVLFLNFYRRCYLQNRGSKINNTLYTIPETEKT